jgi:hypothetical protein
MMTGANAGWRCTPEKYLKSRPGQHGVPSVPSSQYVRMQNGCLLAVDVYLLAGPAPESTFASVVIFTPYTRQFRCTLRGQKHRPTPHGA